MRKSRIRFIFWIVLLCQYLLAGGGSISTLQAPVFHTSTQARKEIARSTPATFVDQYFQSEEISQEENYKKPVQNFIVSGFLVPLKIAGLNAMYPADYTFGGSPALTSPLFILHRNIRI